MSSYAASPSRPNSYASIAGLNFNEGVSGLVDLGNRYKDNPTISGLVIGGLADSFRTQANVGLAGLYNDTFLSSQAKYQRGVEEGRKADTLEIMGAELAGARGLQEGQIRGAIDLQSEQNRGNLDVTREQGRSSLDIAREQAAAQRYGYDSQERQISLTGSEERKNLGAKTNQELRLRADARGAIRGQGARFYG